MAGFIKGVSRRQFGRSALVLLAAAALAPQRRAMAQDTVRLTVVRTDGTETRLGDADLDRLPVKTIDTETAWMDGVHHFEGVLLRDVFTMVGIDVEAPDAQFEALAHNDYSVEIPVADAVKWDVILARRMDGEALTLRDKGPLWIVYPRDDYRELRDARYDHRWVWQLRQLKLL
ncbi:molybdopterin-dependent oxidoreductase [Rhizobiaceae bacterium BDR2-2]|uniref:Molybdopterin-dependent oxidoreductase n=1 Tax=Ectorhizobium quercum TaxID=2965071 RepID=A0AAE3N2L5_9HYPH|nr:molybdopterin-dependent oxidoreductase [Ectorhizobium quercum]MCX8998145.1 molybdopterin-dependent oxidoreductase [Ectorhizobium quercum]